MDPFLICNKIGHETQIIQGICTFPNCKYPRPCCAKCILFDHIEHRQSIQTLDYLKNKFSSNKQDCQWISEFRNTILKMLNKVELILNNLHPTYPSQISLTSLNQFGELIAQQWDEQFQNKFRKRIERVCELLEEDLTNLFNQIQKKNKDYVGKRDQQVENLKDKGKELRGKGKFEEAIDIYDRILQITPEDDDSLNNKGVSLSRINRLEEALQCYFQAIKIQPNNYIYLRNIASCLNNLNRCQEALNYANKAIQINSNYAPSWQSKGIALQNLNQIDQAIECYKKSVEIDPNDIRLFNLAEDLEKLGYKDEAIEYSKKSLKINPNFEKSIQILQRLEEQNIQ